MTQKYTAQANKTIHASAKQVWAALTDPASIKQNMFGSDVVTDWKVGSPIVYKGVWEGKPFEDKGKIVAVEPEKRLVMTYWSPLSGSADVPENYHTITYELVPASDETMVRVSQDNNASEQERDQSAKNWEIMLDGLKKLVEH